MTEENKNECCSGAMMGHGMGCCGNGKKVKMVLVAILVICLIGYLVTLIAGGVKKYNYIGKADRMERSIMITGYGKVVGNNDIAVTTIGYSNTDKDVSKAQADNKKVMDKVSSDLAAMSIDSKDMQTDYTIYPDYEYSTASGSVLKGYKVTNKITVKIRDLTKIKDVLGLAGKYGANEVGGLSFTIDDQQNLKTKARDKAVQDALSKAKSLAQALNVDLIGITSYNEYENSPYNYSLNYSAMGAEGGGSTAPADVSAGSKDIVMNVNITYEIATK